MQLQKAVHTILAQLSDSIGLLSDEQYAKPCIHLSGASIGQHVRHIIEMFKCLDAGYESGVIDYEKRKRDKRIENEKSLALNELQGIAAWLDRPDRPLLLLTYSDDLSPDHEKIGSNYFREIAYNLEHCIHHMALIRIGICELGNIPLEENYGVALSTVKYRKSCAQ